MFIYVHAYDVVGRLHVHARLVDEVEDQPMTTVWECSADLRLPSVGCPTVDLVALVGEELLNMAYDGGPDVTDPRRARRTPVSRDAT